MCFVGSDRKWCVKNTIYIIRLSSIRKSNGVKRENINEMFAKQIMALSVSDNTSDSSGFLIGEE